MRGFAALPLIIILVIAGVVGIGWYTFSTKQQAKITMTPSPTLVVSPSPSPTSTPTPSPKAVISTPKASSAPFIDCVGPDGKHAQSTKQDCDNLWKAWATPTPSPTPTQTSTQSSGGCNTSTDLGNLTVNIQPQSGQSLVGDAAVTMSDGSGDCAGHDSRLPYIQVIRQGSTSITFSGYRPGKFHIKVGYHLNTYDNDVNINPGDNSITVTVSN